VATKQTKLVEQKRAKETIKAEELAKGQREISVSEFFAKNRHLLGFDNPRKALLTTVKEGVDNALDACEEAHILPEIYINIKQHTEDRFTVIIEDNGPGIVKEHIPKVFAKLLYGSKFHSMKQGRGQQGIGISAAAMYGQLTTGKATKIISRISDKRPAYYYELHIDTRRNEPEIVKEEQVEWEKPHGTRVEIDLEAKYLKGKQSVDDYLKQTAIVNPHASIIYFTPENEMIEYPRATDDLPKEPKSIKPHPYGVELGILMKMLQDTKSKTLQSFLMQDFSRVSAKVAKEICDKANLPDNSKPTRIAREESEKLFKAINEVKIMAPPTDCISPIGEELILKGLKKEINAEFYAAVTRSPAVYRGNPFQIECGIAYGGDIPQDDLVRVMRFANRVPLLYQQSACASIKSIVNTAWRSYGLSQSRGALPQGPVIIIVHIASVWVPFTSESKEAIAHYPEIIKELKLALQECGRKLASHIRHTVRAKDQREKLDLFEKYIPEVAVALHNLSGESTDSITEGLLKILKKGLPDLEKNGGKIEENQG
jgi:DNA topoisomerase-6 subunit B